jgi:hypothetical protein
MKDTLARKTAIPATARRRVYFDTQELVQNTTRYDFFPPQASRDITLANYISNSFPGDDARLLYGASFELIKQHIETDAANSIDAEAIINAVKDAGIVITADQSRTEFLRDRLPNYFNFEGNHLNIRTSFAGQAAAADSELTVDKTVTMQSAEGYFKIPDPFFVAPNQVLNVEVTFNDASSFPTSQNWVDAGKSKLFLRSTLHLAELSDKQLEAMQG